MRKPRFKEGEKYLSKYGTEVELLKRVDKSRWLCVIVGTDVQLTICQARLRSGAGFVTPLCKTVYKIGYIGQGPYSCRGSDGKIGDIYSVWANLLKRCYTDYKGNYGKENYKEATVCEEWHNYQNFAKWYEENTLKFKQQGITPYLDKDMKVEGNSMYSPETCLILPNILNCAVRNRANTKVHQGIVFKNGKYSAKRIFKGEHKGLGTYSSLQDAIDTYQTEKVELLKSLADEFKEVLSEDAYNTLCNFKKERC